MAFVSKGFEEALKLVAEGEELFDEDGVLVEVNTHTWGGFGVPYGSISLGGANHPKNRVPIEHYDEFKKKHPGSKVFFRGPRKAAYDPKTGQYNRTAKADATHFYIQDLKEEKTMAFVSKGFAESVKSVMESEILHEVSLTVKDKFEHSSGGTVNLSKQNHTGDKDVWHVHHDKFKPSAGRHGGRWNSKTLGTGSEAEMRSKFSSLKSTNESVTDDELDTLTEEQLIQMAESFEAKLEKIRAKIAKKPKDDYDFEPEKPKAAKTSVTGTYGKSYTDLDDEGKDKVAAVQATQVKRGRGRPRGSKNI